MSLHHPPVKQLQAQAKARIAELVTRLAEERKLSLVLGKVGGDYVIMMGLARSASFSICRGKYIVYITEGDKRLWNLEENLL